MDKLKFFKYSFGCEPDLLPETIVVTPFLPVSRFGKYCDVTASFKGRMYSGSVSKKEDRHIGILRCGIGDRMLGDAVLLLAEAKVKNLIFTGSCASICDARVGDLFVAKRALGGEGFSRYHRDDSNIENIVKNELFAASEVALTDKLLDFASNKAQKGSSLSSGDIFTIGSIMAEDEDLLRFVKSKGISAIEMELSAVYQAARISDIKATALLWVSDIPLYKPLWEEFDAEERAAYNNGMEEAIRLSAEFAFSL